MEVGVHAHREQRRRAIAWDRIWGTLAQPHQVDLCNGVWRYWRYWRAEGHALRVVVNTARQPPRLMTVHWDRGKRYLGAGL
jgi:hypothetical protein